MEYKLYKWTKDILTQYGDGLAIAVAKSVEEARELICKEYYNREVLPYKELLESKNIPLNTDPKSLIEHYSNEYLALLSYPSRLETLKGLTRAIAVDPEEIKDLPCAEYEYGSA